MLAWWGPKSEHMLWSFGMVHFHLNPGLRACRFKFGFLFPMAWPLDDFQGTLNLIGHGSWSMFNPQLLEQPVLDL